MSQSVTDTPLKQASTHIPVADATVESAAGQVPAGVLPVRLLRGYTSSIVIVHLLALLAFTPWFFSWPGVGLAILGHYVFGMLGITLGYHRLLTHKGFTCPKWLERTLALLGVCCLQDSPARWVAIHRKHHQHSDEQADPHSPLVAFLWAHFAWLFVDNRETNNATFYDHYARDLLRDPFYFRLERGQMWLWVYVGHALLFFGITLAIGWAVSGDYWTGVRWGSIAVIWGVFVRTVLVWHVTWSVNSLTHMFGYRSYETGDNSRNNWLVSILAHGEGWHNNHHAEQRAAAHGHRWWELDFTWWTILVLEKVGLVRDVVRPTQWEPPSPDEAEKRASQRS